MNIRRIVPSTVLALSLAAFGCGGDDPASSGAGGQTSSSTSSTDGAGGAGGSGSGAGGEATGGGGAGGAETGSGGAGGAATGSGGAGGSNAGGGGAGGGEVPEGCTAITAGDFELDYADGEEAIYSATSSPDRGEATIADALQLELYDYDDHDGAKTGTFDLSKNGDDAYQTCSRCVMLYEDATDGPSPHVYFPKSGTLELAAGSKHMDGDIDGKLTGVTLIEVDFADGETVPVSGGACLYLASATVKVSAD